MRSTTCSPVSLVVAVLLATSLALHELAVLHAVIGTAFVIAVGVHLWDRRRWIRGVMRRRSRGIPRRLAVDVRWAVQLVVLTIAVTVTGLERLLDPDGGSHLPHGPLGVLLAVVCGIHVLRHRRRGTPGRGTPRRGSRPAPEKSDIHPVTVD